MLREKKLEDALLGSIPWGPARYQAREDAWGSVERPALCADPTAGMRGAKAILNVPMLKN